MTALDEITTVLIRSDVDVPPEPDSADNPPLKSISRSEVKSLEQQKLNHEQDRDRWAFKTLKWCLICLVSIYVGERAMGIAFPAYVDSLANPTLEILKFLVSSLIGFLFAKKS